MANKYSKFSKVKENARHRFKRKFKLTNRRAKSCMRKRAFDTEEVAKRFHKQNALMYKDEGNQKPYKCKNCNMWHLYTKKVLNVI